MLTVKQMLKLERLAASKGILPIELMENAGREVYLTVKEKFGLENKRVVIFAGTGNNAGDGFVAARYFAKKCPVIVLFFGEEDRLKEEAKENYQRIADQINILKISNKEDLETFKFQKDLDFIFIDALLGTGIKGEIKGPIQTAINFFNEMKGIKVAIDVPSGLNPDTGEGNLSCQFDLLIALHDLKKGLERFKEKSIIVDIGIPIKV